jgi:hypothetical protein
MVALAAAAQALGNAVGFFEKDKPELTREKLVEIVLDDLLRPMLLGVVAGHSPERIVADVWPNAETGTGSAGTS